MLEIRPAALAEFSLLPTIEAESDLRLTEIGGRPRTLALPPVSSVEEFAGALHILVAGRPPVGFARLEEIDGQAHLEQLSITPDYARQGIGRALVNAAKAWAKEAGYHSMTLCTFTEVPFNAPFYASCGFTAVTSVGPELTQLRNHEKDIGLDDLGARVTMRIRL